MTVRDDDETPIRRNSLLLQRFHEAWDRSVGTGATLGEDGGEEGGESRGTQWGPQWGAQWGAQWGPQWGAQ